MLLNFLLNWWNLPKKLQGIHSTQTQIVETLHNLERKMTTMATQQDLDNAVTELKTAVSDAATKINQSLSDLEAKIAASGAPVDLTSEVSDIKAVTAALGALSATAVTDDPGAAPGGTETVG